MLKQCSVQFSCSVVSLQPHGLQHARPPHPLPTPGACSNSCPAILSSVITFSCLQSFPASGSFPVSQFFQSGGQSIGISAAACQASLSFIISQTLLKLMSIESVVPSSYLILCRSLILLISVFPSIRVFSNESGLLIRLPKYWSFSFSISPSNEYSGLVSFTINWLDLLAVQGTLKSLLQHHNSKASILRCSVFVIVQLSCPYMITGKTIALTRWTFLGKVMSLLFNMLSRFVIAFLPRSKRLLIPWLRLLKKKKKKKKFHGCSHHLQILEPKRIKSVTVSFVSPSLCHEVMGQDAMILVF